MSDRLERINELAAKAKTTGLTPEEKEEQTVLRREYLAAFRANFAAMLDHTVIQNPDGSRVPLKRRVFDPADERKPPENAGLTKKEPQSGDSTGENA